MERLKGMSITNAHIALVLDGWHLQKSTLNENVIFNVYQKDNALIVLFVSTETHNVEEVV